jgi:hypothetical protein
VIAPPILLPVRRQGRWMAPVTHFQLYGQDGCQSSVEFVFSPAFAIRAKPCYAVVALHRRHGDELALSRCITTHYICVDIYTC